MSAFRSSLRTLLAQMAQDARDLKLSQTASSLTVLTLMALVPVVAVAWMVLTALPAFSGLREGLEEFIRTSVFLPSISTTVMNAVNQFVAAAQRLSALGSLLFLATALGAMLTIDRCLNQIWAAEQPRPLWQRITLYWSMLSLGPVLLGGALALQLRARGELRQLPLLAEALARVSPTLVVTGALFVLYRLVPNTRVRSRHALIGALAAAVLLEAMRMGLAAYLRIMPATTLVYGAFAALPILLTWLFAAWLSVLLGATLAARLPSWGRPTAAMQHGPAQGYTRHVQVLQRVIAQAAEGGVRASDCAALLDNDARCAQAVAQRLSDLGYVLRVWPVQARVRGERSVWQERWLAAPGWPQLTLRPLFEHFWMGEIRLADPRMLTQHAPAGLKDAPAGLSEPVSQALSQVLSQPLSQAGWQAIATTPDGPPQASRS